MTAVSEPPRNRVERIGADALASAGAWRIGDACADFSALRIERADGTVARLTPKAMCVLLVLVRHAGQTLSRDRIMDHVWPGEYPLPDVLSHAIKELRRALGDPVPDSRLIQTVPRVGYRLLAETRQLVAAVTTQASPVQEDPAAVPEIVVADGSRTATAHAAANTVPSDRPPAPRARPRRLPPALGLVATATAVTALWWQRGTLPDAPVSSTPPTAQAIVQAPRVRLLTSTLQQERSPALAPDGRRLAYVRFSSGSQHARIVIASVDAGEGVEIASDSDQDLVPQWSRVGDRLAWQSIRDGQCEIRIARVDGLTVQAVQTRGTCPADVYDSIEWDHDDRGLWLARPVAADAPVTQIVWRDEDGLDHPLAYSRQADDFDSEPRLSPDGRWLVFRRGRPAGGRLFRVPADGGEAVAVSAGVRPFGRFDWLPDARHLLVPVGAGGQRELFRLDTEGGPPQALGLAGADQVDVPDRLARAVFEVERGRPRFQLWLHQTDGGEPLRVAASTGSDRDACFAPSGSGLAFISDRSGSSRVWTTESPAVAPRALPEDGDSLLADLSCSEDGHSLLYVRVQADRSTRVLRHSVAGSTPTQVLELPHARVRAPRRLGAGLAYLADEGQGWRAWWVADIAAGSPPQAVADFTGLAPMLEVDGERLCVLHLATAEIRCSAPPYTTARTVHRGLPLMASTSWRIAAAALWYLDQDSTRLRTLVMRQDLRGGGPPLPSVDLGELQIVARFAVSPDGRRLLVQKATEPETDIGSIELAVP